MDGMYFRKNALILAILLGLSLDLFVASSAFCQEKFQIIVLGCEGGPYDSNLSSYLIAPIHSSDFVALDAGSLLEGIKIAYEKGSFADISLNPHSLLNPIGDIFQNHIKAYLISHAHLDHVSGLVLCSVADSKKNLLAIDPVIDDLKSHLFNWKIWPNFGSEGVSPILHRYQYQRLACYETTPVPDTEISVKAFPLHHDGVPSSAFLIETNGDFVIYFGDTESDGTRIDTKIATIWKELVPLIQKQKLHAIFLECSYSSQQPSHHLYGHLNTTNMMNELRLLATLVDPLHKGRALKNLKVIVTHRKESLFQGENPTKAIQEELEKYNDLGIEFIFPHQGEKIIL